MARFEKLTIKDIRKETPDCVSIAFEIPEDLKPLYTFTQGQNLTLRLKLNNEEIRRSYSICSSPLDNELRVAVKKVMQGRFSSHANIKLRKGDAIEVLPPTGKFYTELQSDHKKKYLAFAAGSGITPIISIIKTTLATEAESEYVLIYGNRNRSSIIFKEQLEALKNRYIDRLTIHHILSREKTDAVINHGRINAEKCIQLQKLIDFRNMDDIFLCGPEEMIFSVRDWLYQQGIEHRKIHFEFFTTPGVRSELKIQKTDEIQDIGPKSKVSIKLDGIMFDFELSKSGASILDGALQQGAELPYACKGGVCSTCRAKLVSGEVTMDTNYALEPDEIAKGFILTCQSHPVTDSVIVDFDVK
ncbi:MAG: phenylacetate-CoA oxygenase/reductase subunit PaaK [Chitinophagaceae bacterium]|nr:phenylacetate-CoA oxygenase/reductase subunit PaaK [Chitinophagaceae bacterium]